MSDESIETPEEIEMEKRFQQAVDPETGEWKSLGHQYEYYGEFQDLPEGSPDPHNYPPSEEDHFREDYNSWRRKTEMKEALTEVFPPPPPRLDLPDDEHWKERREADDWEKECLRKAEKAAFDGKPSEARAWRERADFKKKDLEEKGPSLREQVEEEYKWLQSRNAVSLLFDPQMESNPVWEHPRMQWDAHVELHRCNKLAKDNIIRLPKEVSEWGEIEPLKPSNMVLIELEPEKMKEVQRALYFQGGGQDPTDLTKKAWAILRRLGYASLVKPAIPSKSESETETKEEDPEDPWGSQKDYEKWRMKQGGR